MPVPWLFLPPTTKPPFVTQVDEELTVVSKQVNYDPINQIYRFTDGVTAKYGPTTLTADELEVQGVGEKGSGFARGNVKVVDPDGTLNARDVRFAWDKESRVGHAEEVDVNFAGVVLRAKSADVQPGIWTLTDVYGTSCLNDPPLFAVSTPKVTLITGQRGVASRPSVYVFGHKLITLPTQKFNLDPRTQGFRPPNVTYRKDDGLGVNWSSGWLLNPQTDLTASIASFRQDRPSYSVELSRSFVPGEATTARIAPRSDLADHLNNAYFENVEQPSPKTEEEYLSGRKDTVSVGSYWFHGAANQRVGADYTKAIDVAYERGGEFGSVIGFAQARLQTIRKDLEPFHTRFEFLSSVGLRPMNLAPNLAAYTRVDAQGFIGGNSSGWLRAQIGLTYQPVKPITLGAAIHRSTSFGTPLFEIDELESPQGVTVRFDGNLGPTQLSYLWRYDSAMGWYDRQYMVSQIAGCLQPYILYRQWYNDYRIGLNVRLGNLAEVLKRRKYERGDATKTVIDGPGRATR